MNSINIEKICAHCGDVCRSDTVERDGKFFCCSGCLFVYELLRDSKLDNYYALAEKTGIKPIIFDKDEFAYLDNDDIKEKILLFSIAGASKVTLFIPEIYCSACLWLLENIYRLNKGILESSVNLLKREITITFSEKDTSLRQVVELLTSLGYRPKLSIATLEGKKQKNPHKPLYFKVGVAGFVFGNIMLFAFPEYLAGEHLEPDLKLYFSYLTLLLSLGALYAASDFFKAAWYGLKMKSINIDIPICIGVLAIFIRSAYEIISGSGPGFMDSLAGLVFLLLTGRVFRQKTFHTLSFDRDYKSYFPLSVIRKAAGKEEFVSLKEIKPGDKLLIRNNEIIPTDSILLSGKAFVDYSFVTGESKEVAISKNEKIYAGGLNRGSAIEINAVKIFSQSYITDLWNHSSFSKQEPSATANISNTAAKYFTTIVITIALGSLFFWLPSNSDRALNAFTAVLIIACPCAFSLALPFAYGAAIRVFGRSSFFLKNDQVVEKIAHIDSIVFDKTGTLTEISKSHIEYKGIPLTAEESAFVKSAAKHSTHPLSRLVYRYFSNADEFDLQSFSETAGSGIEAVYNERSLRLGKKEFVEKNALILADVQDISTNNLLAESTVFLSIDNKPAGSFSVKPAFRNGISKMMKILLKRYKIYVLSGDNSHDADELAKMTDGKAALEFNKLPIEKLNYIKHLKQENRNVMFIGDGLNDAGALRQSSAGVAISDADSNFTPGSDAILYGNKLTLVPNFLQLARKTVGTVYLCFTISVFYNFIGLYFAVQGLLTPVIAAILMPISSISIMAISVLKVKLDARRIGIIN